MKLNLKLFAVDAAVLAGAAARAGSTYDPLTVTGELQDGGASTEALGYGALVVESTDIASEPAAGSGSGETEVGTKRAQEQRDAEFRRNIWTMP